MIYYDHLPLDGEILKALGELSINYVFQIINKIFIRRTQGCVSFFYFIDHISLFQSVKPVGNDYDGTFFHECLNPLVHL